MNDSEPLRTAILQRLTRVIDPETGVDVVRMRLIENLQVDETGRVSYTFRPSSPLCPIAVPLAIEIRRAVAATPGVTRQAMRVEGYMESDALNALLAELADEHDSAAAPGTTASGQP
jgi:metal-sulfur cluster biosynthetic enzyme